MNWIWNPATHIQLCKHALNKMSEPFNKIISIYPEYFELGIIAPDKLFCDSTNHYYNCTPSAAGYHYGSVVKKIIKETELINHMIDNHDKLVYHPNCASYIQNILDNPVKALVFELGVISHYVADLHQPFHTDGKYRFELEEVPHKIYEADVRKNFNKIILNIGKRRYPVKDMERYLYDKIYNINKYYDSLINCYFLTPNKVKPDRWKKAKTTTEKFLSEAAKCIANVWYPFEKKIHVYKSHIKNLALLHEIKGLFESDRMYHLKIYDSGTISLRRKK
ncbi:MAG: zinc dependent phospholipase C family protein [Candidatus Cloacimonetes bacterium]|nr:zinc dependent phospholipase C family protein [Candidatus Cloacimonadota bacterium]